MPSAIPPCGGAPYCRASKQESESLAGGRLVDAQQPEHLLLKLLIVDTDRAAARFITVDYQIVRLSPALLRIGAKHLAVLRAAATVKGWCIAVQQFSSMSHREHRKLDDPGEVHRRGIVELQLGPQPLPQGIQRLAGDLELVGGEQQEIARRGVHATGRSWPSSSGLKFLAIGEASRPSASTLNQASPFAPKFSTTKAVSSSMPLRE